MFKEKFDFKNLKDEIIELYSQGNNHGKIAKKIGCCRRTITRKLNEWGVKSSFDRSKERKNLDSFKKEIEIRYRKGESTDKICEDYKISATTLKKRFIKWKIESNEKINSLDPFKIKIINAYKNGERVSKLAKKYNCSPDRIRRYLKRNNIKIIRNPLYLDIEHLKNEVITLYKNGLSVTKISIKLGIEKPTLLNRMKKWGINVIKLPQRRSDIDLKKDEIIKYYNEGKFSTEIANLLNISPATILKRLKIWGIDTSLNMGAGKLNRNWKGYEDISGSMFAQIKKGAEYRNIKFDISIEEVWLLYKEQNGICALSGEKLVFDSKTKESDGNVSLDRKDSSKHYYKDNCQLVTKEANIHKLSMSDDKFIEMCTKISEYNKNKKENKCKDCGGMGWESPGTPLRECPTCEGIGYNN